MAISLFTSAEDTARSADTGEPLAPTPVLDPYGALTFGLPKPSREARAIGAAAGALIGVVLMRRNRAAGAVVGGALGFVLLGGVVQRVSDSVMYAE